jgi:eukaryotic-like serine/threonine-protein kinase
MSMALKHVQMEPEPPSRRTELPIPPELEQLVMRCLAKSPEARPSSAREIAAILDRIPGPAWTDDEAARWWERHLPPTSSLRSFAQTETPNPRVIQKA